jgi:hypothetical protein
VYSGRQRNRFKLQSSGALHEPENAAPNHSHAHFLAPGGGLNEEGEWVWSIKADLKKANPAEAGDKGLRERLGRSS